MGHPPPTVRPPTHHLFRTIAPSLYPLLLASGSMGQRRGHWIANGATTLHENWDMNATRDISDNHMMFGEIGAWFYKGLAGLYPDPQAPGFKHILLRPNFPQDLQHFEADFLSPYGNIRISWQHRGKRNVECTVLLPAGSSATFQAPSDWELASGTGTCTLKAGTHVLRLIAR